MRLRIVEKLSIFVTVGTSHYNFDRMLNSVKDYLGVIEKSLDVTLQYGNSSCIDVGHISNCKKFFTREESEGFYKNSDLIFSHCGIGSIFNSLKYNRPTVIFTRREMHNEFSDDHQLQIAKELVRNPLILIASDEKRDLSKFNAFINEKINKEKKLVDLTNHGLAHFINSRLYSNE